MTRTPLVGLVKRGPWTAEEDLLLKKYIEANGIQRWSTLPQKAGLMRCGKSCRLRWMNHLRPNVKRGQISPDEEDLIIRLHNLLGNRWSLIAGRVPGRTDNEVKNYWNTHLSKKLASRSVSRGKAVTQIVEEQPLSCGDHQKGKAKPMITLVEGSHFKITHDKSSSKIQTTKNAIVSDNHSFGSVSPTDSTALPLQFEQDYPDSQLADANVKYSGTELPDSTILGDGYKFGRAEDQFFSGTGSIAPWFIEINMEEDIFLPITRFEQGISTTELCSDSFISSWTCSDNLLGE